MGLSNTVVVESVRGGQIYGTRRSGLDVETVVIYPLPPTDPD